MRLKKTPSPPHNRAVPSSSLGLATRNHSGISELELPFWFYCESYCEIKPIHFSPPTTFNGKSKSNFPLAVSISLGVVST